MMNRCFLATSLLVVFSVSALAQQQVLRVSASNSARASGTSLWNCCSLNAIGYNEARMLSRNCTTQGGYCMGSKRMATWVFPMPDLGSNTTLRSVRFKGQTTGGGFGSGAIWIRWTGSTLDLTSINGAVNNPSWTRNRRWPVTGNYSQTLPLAQFQGSLTGKHLTVVAYQNATVYFENQGATAPVLEFTVDGGCGITAYGSTVGGANVASLSSVSTPRIASDVDLVAGGYGGAGVSFLAFGLAKASSAFGSGTLLIDLGQASFLTSMPIGANGAGGMRFRIPDDTNLIGAKVFMQTAKADASIAGGVALSNGLELVVCSK